jgi:hypothetical protein
MLTEPSPESLLRSQLVVAQPRIGNHGARLRERLDGALLITADLVDDRTSAQNRVGRE